MIKENVDTTYLQTLGSGLSVLNLLSREPFLTLADIGNRIGCNPPKAYRLLATLETDFYVAKTPEKTYYLGPAAIALGFSGHRCHPLVVQARDVLDWLVEETKESSYLVIRHELARVVLDMRDAPQRLRTFAPVGEEHPLYVSGAGLTLLAFAPDAVVTETLQTPVAPITHVTETDPARIADLLQAIRQRGHHVSREDFKVGAFSVGAPVFNRSGRCEAALAVAGPLSQLTEARETLIIERVTEAAGEMSARLGFLGHGRT